MIKKIITCLWVLFFLVMVTNTASAATKPPAQGDLFPAIVLNAPPILDQQKYLGLSKATTFTIPQIKAEIVIVEIFSMYCPYCQAEAPSLNELYHKIQNNSSLKGRCKIIGIGAGNTTFEVDHFRNTYNIPFPLFPDDDFAIHKKIGNVRTPYFFVIGIRKEGTPRILYTHQGRLQNHDQFINMLLQHTESK